MFGMRSFEFRTSSICARMGAYSGRDVSSASLTALRSRTQASARSPCTSSSQPKAVSVGVLLAVGAGASAFGVCDMAGLVRKASAAAAVQAS